jgi:hypothetical protein
MRCQTCTAARQRQRGAAGQDKLSLIRVAAAHHVSQIMGGSRRDLNYSRSGRHYYPAVLIGCRRKMPGNISRHGGFVRVSTVRYTKAMRVPTAI